MKKTLAQIIVAIGALVAVLGMVIDAFIYGVGIPAFNIAYLDWIVIVIAVSFVFSKKDTLLQVGYFMLLILGVSAFTTLLYPDLSVFSYFSISTIGYFVMAIGAIIFFLVKLLKIFGFVKANDKGAEVCDVVVVLNKYKEMEKDNTITEEEFNALKDKVLRGADKEVSSIDDLKQWKKLYDQKVITDEEFASIKSKIFSK